MADQIGLAIQNARLNTESQDAIQRLEIISAENVRSVWRERVRSNKRSYRYTSMGLTSATQPGNMPSSTDAASDRLNVPITLRGQILGTIVLQRKAEKAWSETDRSLANEIASQVALALENARLLDEAQKRAAQEQSLSKLSVNMGLSLDPDTILQTAIRELHQLPNVSEVSAFLSSPQPLNDKSSNLK
jgi:GAF domain-containing protein